MFGWSYYIVYYPKHRFIFTFKQTPIMKTRRLRLNNRVVSVLSPDKAQQIRGASDVQCGTDSGPMCTISDNECYETYNCTQQGCETQSCPPPGGGGGNNNTSRNCGGGSSTPNGDFPDFRDNLFFHTIGDWT